jgi:uncharacterized protein YjeT (DUF2065 family)
VLLGAVGAATLTHPSASVASGPLVVVSLVLIAAGVAKALRPAPARQALGSIGLTVRADLIRVLGAAEVALGVSAAWCGGPVPAALVALAYAGFLLISRRLSRGSADAGCGCFGSAGSRPGALHLWLNALAGAGAAAGATTGGGGIVSLAGTPGAGVLAIAGCLLAAALLVAAFTVLPDTVAATRPPTSGGPATFSIQTVEAEGAR